MDDRVAFLRSKHLTDEEIRAAVSRTGAPGVMSTTTHRATARLSDTGNTYLHSMQKPHVPDNRRDWRDWFIMATVLGGFGYGIYTVAKVSERPARGANGRLTIEKRYVFPVVAPPTTPQLENDKQAIDDSFERAFSLLEQLAKDTEALKLSEENRSKYLETTISEVEDVVGELREAGSRREEDYRRINEEVRSLRLLIPRAIDGQREATDTRIHDLSLEVQSLRALLSQRMHIGSAKIVTPDYPVTQRHDGPSENLLGGKEQFVMSSSPGTVTTENEYPVDKPQIQMIDPNLDRTVIPSWQLAAASREAHSDGM